MNVKSENPTACQSMFKNGTNATTKTEFTNAYIRLIHQLEKNKCHSPLSSGNRKP